MIRLLPFILIPILILGALGWWRFNASKQTATVSPLSQEDSAPVEVPKTLPNATIDDRVKALEDILTKLIPQVNNLKSQSNTTQNSSAQDSRIAAVEGAVTELKARVSALEKASPAPGTTSTSSSQSTIYIPLGSGGGPWGNRDWYSMPEYEINLDPANYPGYSGMSLEVTFRMTESAGTGSIRFYNLTNSTAVSGQVDTTSTSFELKSTSSFTLTSGAKTYRLQVKSTEGKDIFIQSARIKVSF